MDELLKAALAGAVAAAGGDRAPGVRRRTGHPGGHPSPARRHLRGWLAGHGDCRLRHRFPSLPGQAGGTKRLRRVAGADRPCHRGHRHDTARGSGDGWIVDATPVEGGRSNQTLKGSALAGWACSGRGASHARWFGAAAAPGLHPARPGRSPSRRPAPGRRPRGAAGPAGRPATPGRRPARAAAAGGRQARPRPRGRGRPGRAGRAAAATDAHGPTPTAWRAAVQAAAAADRVGRPHLQGQLDLERHGGHTPAGGWVRVLGRTLA